MLRDSSVEAYQDRILSGADYCDKQRILELLKRHNMTRLMIATELCIPTATVSGLVTPMVNAGDVIESPNKSPCLISGRRVYWLQHPGNSFMGSFLA